MRRRHDHDENPSLTLDRLSGSYQLLSDGHLDLVLDKCSDYWDGESLRRMTNAVNSCFPGYVRVDAIP
jgi:hypothetical protein